MKEAIRSYIARPDPAGFEDLALALYQWQVRHNPDYAAVAAGAHPLSVADIPAVPVGLFQDLNLACFDTSKAAFRFHTSGTSTGRPGTHCMADSDLYNLSAITWFRACVPRAPADAISLVPPPRSAPHSSLSHMVDLLYPGANYAVDDQGAPDVDAAWSLLSRIRAPVFLATTALALDRLLALSRTLALPEGSCVMLTGGFKGHHTHVDGQTLLTAVHTQLGAPVIGEYGMTELRSQMWTPLQDCRTANPEGPFLPPPWMRVLVVDPDTGRLLAPDTPGQIRFVDLANHDTVLAIETLDHGTLHADGSVHLHGRLPHAPIRGCSLTVEEARHRA